MVQLQALLMLGLLEDVFNPRTYALGRENATRTPARAIYASYIKGISWTIVQWLTKVYTFKSQGFHIDLVMDRFKEDCWYGLVGRQLATLNLWRQQLVKNRIYGSIEDCTPEELEANTATLLEELDLVAEHHPKIAKAYKDALSKPSDMLTPLVDPPWTVGKWRGIRSRVDFEGEVHFFNSSAKTN
jgi:hypothetical protein